MSGYVIIRTASPERIRSWGSSPGEAWRGLTESRRFDGNTEGFVCTPATENLLEALLWSSDRTRFRYLPDGITACTVREAEEANAAR